MSTAKRFGSWVESLGVRTLDVAYRLGCDTSYIGRIQRGERKPGRRLAAAIEAATRDWDQGPITVASWDAPAAEAA